MLVLSQYAGNIFACLRLTHKQTPRRTSTRSPSEEVLGTTSVASSASPRKEEALWELRREYEPEDLVEGDLYSVHNVTVPVFPAEGDVVLIPTAYHLPPAPTVADITTYSDVLTKAAHSLTGGQE